MSTQHQAEIRDFRPSDLARVVRLIHDTIDVSYAEAYPPRAVEFFKAFHSEEKLLGRHKAGTILVIEHRDKPVATGALVEAEILAVFVHPEFQNRGYGKGLMRELETRAANQGCSHSELSISLPSREFYQSLGYQFLEERSRDVGEGQRLDFWKARKTLVKSGPSTKA